MNEILPKLDGLSGTVVSTPIFFLIFVGVIWWVFRGKRKSEYEEISKLPLDDEDKEN